MAAGSTSSATREGEERTPELEAFFAKYPRTPREVIVKQDILRLGMRFTREALREAKRRNVRIKSYARLFAYTRQKLEEMDGEEAFGVPEEFSLEGGPYKLREIHLGPRLSPDAPYVVDVDDGRVVMRVNGRVLGEVQYGRAPRYYSMTFEDGTRYQDVVCITSPDLVFVTTLFSCQLWGRKEECRFCDINETYRQMRKSGLFTLRAPLKPVDRVATVVEAAYKEATSGEEWMPGRQPNLIHISGGTIVKDSGIETRDWRGI